MGENGRQGHNADGIGHDNPLVPKPAQEIMGESSSDSNNTVDQNLANDLAVEAILNELDPGLEQQFADLMSPANDGKSTEESSDINEMAEELDAVEGLTEELGGSRNRALIQKLLQKIRYLTQRSVIGCKNLAFFLLHGGREQVKLLPVRVKKISQSLSETTSRLRKAWNTLSWARRTLLLVWILLLAILGGALKLIFSTGIIQVPEAYLLGDFRVVADRVYTYDGDVRFEEYYSSLRLPEYIVLFEKLVVNLKPSVNSSNNPMGTLQVYLEGTKREAAIELKDREKEFLDVMQRVVEDIPYDELRTSHGKQKMKTNIRNEINSLINHGRVRRVYLKHFITKP